MPAEMPLAAIIEEVRWQVADFQTVILKTGHALRLVAIAEAAVEMREGAQRLLAYHDKCGMNSSHGVACADGIVAFDAAASAGEGK